MKKSERRKAKGVEKTGLAKILNQHVVFSMIAMTIVYLIARLVASD